MKRLEQGGTCHVTVPVQAVRGALRNHLSTDCVKGGTLLPTDLHRFENAPGRPLQVPASALRDVVLLIDQHNEVSGCSVTASPWCLHPPLLRGSVV
jgi:hypothetical protein